MSAASRAAAKCPIRTGEPCRLCVPGVEGLQDCGLVYLVTSDPEMREQWNAHRAREAERARRGAAAQEPATVR